MRHSPRASVTRRDEGMSLVELVVAVVVLAIVSTSVLAIILQAQASTVNNRARVAAANLAARELDIVREEFTRSAAAPVEVANAGTLTNPNPLAGGTAGQPLHLDGTPYTVVRSVQWNIMGEGQSACDGGSLVQYPTLGVTVTVTWPNMGSTRPVTSHAALAPRKGSGVPSTSSFVAVHVVDSTGADNPGRAVRVTGSNGEVRIGTTDGSGCAVLTVNPSASGTSYAAQLNDSGYVDIAGTNNPTKDVGTLTPGQLNNSVTFAYDVPGTLRVRIVDPDGNPVPSAEVAGSQVSLVSSSGGGASSSAAYPVTGTVTEIGGLWPGTYGGYYGVTAPGGGYNTANVAPGGTEDLDVTLLLATGSFTNLPPGTDTVIAVPGTGDCTAPEARTINPSDFRLIPGDWTFYAGGDAFECSPGPSPVELSAGDTGETAWGTTTLRVDGAP